VDREAAYLRSALQNLERNSGGLYPSLSVFGLNLQPHHLRGHTKYWTIPQVHVLLQLYFPLLKPLDESLDTRHSIFEVLDLKFHLFPVVFEVEVFAKFFTELLFCLVKLLYASAKFDMFCGVGLLADLVGDPHEYAFASIVLPLDVALVDLCGVEHCCSGRVQH